MPFLDLPSVGLRMYYEMGSPAIDPSKPTLLLLHAGVCTASFFSSQLKDPRLNDGFNLVALESRFHGRSESELRETFVAKDNSVDCLAAVDALQLTSYSIMAEGHWGVHTACWMAIERPSQVKALVLASPCPPSESPELQLAMVEDWLPWGSANKDGNGDDTGTIPDGAMKVVSDYFFGKLGREPERRAAFLESMQAHYGTGQPSIFLKIVVSWFLREPIPPALCASLTVPIMILQGGEDINTSPLAAAEAWQASFTSAQDGADLRIINGAPHLLSYTDANITNRYVLGFLSKYVK
ncbi:Alpha/Beta hydrolase protein [Leucosporidium creatinivorum]|uniref:Alpha/Beta hydrolase protein n=1 Tax=Leucosporidium creatinivorum TaxID=106004 RepID=A0A1Y2G4E1_9BASI|nr:Alpha/Beta hydrolase protein [Leucosporidium creatinivorum]